MRHPYRPPFAIAPVAAPAGRPAFSLADSALPSSIQAIGFTLNMIFVFVVFSRLPELIASKTGLNIPFAMLLALLATPIALISGSPARLMKMRPVQLLTAFTFWIIIAAPFSQWRGGTWELFIGIWIKTILICLVIAMVVISLEQVRKMLYALAYATLLIIVTALLWGGSEVGRLVVGAGSLSNPNEIASRLLTGFCFCLFVVWTEKGLTFKKGLILVAMPVLLILALKTGSRSGLLTLVALVLILFLRASAPKKVLMLAGGFVLTMILLAVLPEDIRSRYATTFSSNQSMYDQRLTDEDRMAIGSKAARTALAEEALTIIGRYPIFGVGAGVYVDAAGAMAQKEGRRAMWHETHNTYLQLAAEDGIIGLLLYMSAVFICCKRTFSIYRRTEPYPDLKIIRDMSYCLFLALVSWATGSIFDSRAYLMELPILVALTSAFVLTAESKITEYLASFAPVVAPAYTGMPNRLDGLVGFHPR